MQAPHPPISPSALSQSRNQILGLIAALFVTVITLEYSTPPPFVFGYLYVGAVLIAGSRLGRRATIGITTLAIFLTLLNLVFPGRAAISAATLANRGITTLALLVTGWLSDRVARYEDAINRQQLQILTQQETAKMREDFVSTLAHDLKTPLLGGLETLKALQAEKFGPLLPSQRKVLDIMARSHQKTLALVNTLMDVYRIDAEGLLLHCQPVDLTTLVAEAVADMTNLASSRQIHIRLQHEHTEFCRAYWVQADILQLHRVLVNLLTNAVNHSLRGGRVDVVLGTHGKHHRVQVIDEGRGIQHEDLPHLFERFYQGQSDRQAKGSGLGLYLSRQIIEAHSGKIWAENRVSQGAVFAVQLPALVDTPPGPFPSSQANHGPSHQDLAR